jgi:hypothetical protein
MSQGSVDGLGQACEEASRWDAILGGGGTSLTEKKKDGADELAHTENPCVGFRCSLTQVFTHVFLF